MFPHQNNSTRPAGARAKYRATTIGPGVTPDVMWEGTDPGSYRKEAEAQKNAEIKALRDAQCEAN